MDNGVATEEEYPYTATNGNCTIMKKSEVEVAGYVYVNSTENDLLEAVGMKFLILEKI